MTNLNCEQCDVLNKSIFSAIELCGIKYISNKKCCISYKKGMPIFCSGTMPSGIYCLNKGKVKIHIYGSIKEHIIRFVMPGHLFGLGTIFTNHFYCCATAIEDSTVCKINKEDFLSILNGYPNLSLKLMTVLGQYVEYSNNKIISIAEKSVRERLAEGLLSVYKTFHGEFPVSNADNSDKAIILSREDIANFINTSTESVIRTLSELKNEGYIIIKGRSIFLKNIKGLMKIAGIY